MADMKTVERTKFKPDNLRAPESVIHEYKKIGTENIKDLERQEYDVFAKRLRSDPVRVMLEASDLGMSLEQYANFRAPDTMMTQGRSVISRVMEDDGLYAQDSALSASAPVDQFMDNGYRQAILYAIVNKAWDGSALSQRAPSVQLPSSQAQGTPPNTETIGTPPPIAAGVALNPGELIGTTHSISTNNYNPYKWDYDKEALKRTAVAPGDTIPPSTLGEESGAIPMQKWGNRFILPYEMLVGGQGLRINKLAAMIQLDAATEQTRQFDELIETLEDGDGVTGAATVEGISTYGGTANSFGFVPYLNWLDEAMDTPFQISHVVMLKAQQRQLRTTLAALDGNLAFEQLSSVGLAPNRMSNMEGQMSVRYGKANDGALTAGYVVGCDYRYAIEKVNRAGMAVREQARQIANQTQEVVISDTYLLARLADEAVKILDIGS